VTRVTATNGSADSIPSTSSVDSSGARGPQSAVEQEVARLQGLVKRARFEEALLGARKLLADRPENRDLLYIEAVCHRYCGRPAQALQTLARFEHSHPRFGRLHQERGHCYRALGQIEPAVEAYRRAVSLNEALLASWKALAELCRRAGQADEAKAAASRAEALARLPPALLSAAGMMAEGELHRAERVLRQFLLQHPNDVEAMRLLARIGIQWDVLDDAEFLLHSALVFAPDHHVARYDYAVVLSKRHKHAAALTEARRLLELDPRNRAYRTLFATVCVGLGDHEAALAVFRQLAAETPENAELHLSIAHALKTLGRQGEAIEAYRHASAARPSFGDAYWSLANLKTYRFTDEELAVMRTQEAAQATSTVDRYHLCFALGKALEDGGDYSESFGYYARGNALKHDECGYDSRAFERAVGRQKAVFTREFLDSRRGSGCPRPDPIFIVGLPRAGSTLIEQILASHSQVEGTMELADIPRLALRLEGHDPAGADSRYPGSRYPDVVAEIDADALRRLGEKYLSDTQVYRSGKPCFIDKMPNNFRHLGLIHLILPNARIIDARREAMACCFSNFKQLYAQGQEFSYSLEDIGRYYRAYLELMAHWDAVLPGRILRVCHEEVVADLEGNVRRILDFLGLAFEPGCLEFFKTERSVRTASSEQVRQPLFREGLEQWRHFEPWLTPLKTALGEVGTTPRQFQLGVGE
jgi:tetratricopeptide (TPR) repeat protein